jgi:hypothetical protein
MRKKNSVWGREDIGGGSLHQSVQENPGNDLRTHFNTSPGRVGMYRSFTPYSSFANSHSTRLGRLVELKSLEGL